ncbi:hypothetical protein AMTRI_Chr03g54110 [Amborella trichopoda]
MLLEWKSSWPELVGVDGKVAAATIERENPNVQPRIIPPGTIILPVFLCDRVLVMVDENGIVTEVPNIG